VRVLFISDVYFPRVNGVSTSIGTFREDLASCGIDTLLVAPQYAPAGARPGATAVPARGTGAAVEAQREAGVVRVPAAPVPRDPEDRRMFWGALTRTLDALPRGELDLVHIHTPFIAHTPECVARAASGCRVSRPITPSSRSICTTTCRCCRAR